MALTPHSVIMTRLFGGIVKSIEWSQRFSWWTSFVSEHQCQFHFESSLILSKGFGFSVVVSILSVWTVWTLLTRFLDTVITCFPQRWDQPKQDPLNVIDGIVEETNAKTRPPIQSVYDLAMVITGRVSGLFECVSPSLSYLIPHEMWPQGSKRFSDTFFKHRD